MLLQNPVLLKPLSLILLQEGEIMKVNRRVIQFLFHPLFISFIVSLAIILLFFPKAPKYIINQVYQSLTPDSDLVFYDDLDGNGYADRILASHYAKKNGISSVLIQFYPALFLQEWDFQGNFSFTNNRFVMTGDYDGNQLKEFYLFTISHDSVFLHIVSNLLNKTPLHKTRFISSINTIGGQPNLQIYINELIDMNLDGFKDLVFAINSGLPISPRNVYIYDILNDSLRISPINGYPIYQVLIRDITGDGYNEIVLNGYASQNVQDTNKYLIHDMCCWLIVLDHQLNYLFPPVKFSNYGYSGLSHTCIPNNHGYFDIYSSYLPPQASGKSICLYHFKNTGEILSSRSIPGIKFNQARNVYSINYRGVPNLIIPYLSGGILTFDTNFKETKIHLDPGLVFSPFDTLDIDGDYKKEIISLSSVKQELIIFRADLSQPAYIQLPNQDCGDAYFSLKTSSEKMPLLVMYSRGNEFHYRYKVNKMFYTRWGIFLGIFLAVYLFILLVNRIQRAQIERRQKIEKKITELQMKIVRNQMDPHFTMNAVNSIIASINENEKKQATQHLVQFSDMYRHLVLTADKITCSLGEELDFTRNYLAMEQFRFRNKFSFDISISPEVNLNWAVPKMVIQSPVENAVKHGLLNLHGKGNLIIRVLLNVHYLILEIEDNGIGRKKAAEFLTNSTGKGMLVMQEFLRLYQKTTGIKVETDIQDLISLDGLPIGTKVCLRMNINDL